MIKINKITHRFTAKDVKSRTLSAINLEYEIRVYRPAGWEDAVDKFLEAKGKDDLALAIQVIGLSLVNVYQDGQCYPIGDPEKAKDLIDSVEDQAPGFGANYASWLALIIYNQVINLEEERLGNLEPPLPESSNGEVTEPLPLPA